MKARAYNDFWTLAILVRWLTAAMAVMYHVRFLLFAPYPNVNDTGWALTIFYFVTGLGHEAFVMYMVISGLLIGGPAVRRWLRGINPCSDLVRRSTWFYSLLTPALLFGGAYDLIGSSRFAASGVYAYFPQYSPMLNLETFTGNMLMLQRFVVPGLGSNTMLYLLAYECWAYLILFAWFVLRKRNLALAWHTSLFVTVAGGLLAPEFIGYFILWMLGMGVYRTGHNTGVRISRLYGVLAFTVGLLASRLGGAHLHQMPDAIIPAVRMALDLLFGSGFALLAMAVLTTQEQHAIPARFQLSAWKLNRNFKGADMVLFATHFPFMMFIVAAASSAFHVTLGAQPGAPAFAMFGVTIFAIYLHAYAFSAWISPLAEIARQKMMLPWRHYFK